MQDDTKSTDTVSEQAHPEFTSVEELHHLDMHHLDPVELYAIEEAAERGGTNRALIIAAAVFATTIAVFAAILSIISLSNNPSESLGGREATVPAATAGAAVGDTASHTAEEHDAAVDATASAAAPKLADAKDVKFEKFEPVDATLPAIPAGPVKTFKVDVFQHVTQVDKTLAPTEVWSFAVNGKYYRGTGLSGPMVVTEGDTVDFTLVNGSNKSMQVDVPHSLDFHSAEVAPSKRYTDLAPGKSMHYRFVAKHPGVYMYHCATQPVLMHTGAGMVGMFVVKPKGLAPADKELFITQQEFYIGKAGGPADMNKMSAKKPDVIAFNGFANQYKDKPITVAKGEKVRMYVLNAGPSVWSAFHVIGTVFDRTVIEGTVGHDVQTVNLAPSQGGWVEFTLDEEGSFPFVNHAFGDMVKGSLGVIRTEHAPAPKAGASH